MDELFYIEPKTQIRCKDCKYCNIVSATPPYHSQSICINKKTTDKRYKFGYVTVKPTKYHYCNMFNKSK